MADAIDILIDLHCSADNVNDREAFKRAVLSRENEMSTALVSGIALPHAKASCVKRPALAKITLKTPVKWHDETVGTVYMLASPDDSAHIKMLSALADYLQSEGNN